MKMHDPAHPGEVLREYLPSDMSVSEAAKHLKVTRQTLSALLNSRSDMSVEMALRLEAALGIEADFWLKLQLQRDLWVARKRPTPQVTKITA
ncbi:HigA family addiction module antitoxin [Leptospirillum ferriphilum]|uniref:Putative HTH-type transcriptional regulator YbaQ n=1 Tax=Leptospirillum ferriphilum TaxID=178606 RepID=A0A2I2MFU1_9BACT|nr:HigA family addiction module antitoxin [Leptospirillum ferriphilum]